MSHPFPSITRAPGWHGLPLRMPLGNLCRLRCTTVRRALAYASDYGLAPVTIDDSRMVLGPNDGLIMLALFKSGEYWRFGLVA